MNNILASIRRHGAAAILGALSISTCHSSIVGPYAPDTDTLHLWHLNESAVPALDAVSVASGGTNLAALQNAATLGNASFSGFGTAVNTYGPGPNNPGASSISVLTLPNGYVTTSFADPTTGAFTFEAIVKITYNPATAISVARSSPLTIISGEGNTAAARIFNFRLDPVGFNPNAGGYTTALTEPMLEFINLNKASAVQNILIPIPTSGNDAIVQNGWYHVAVTYSGQPGAANNLNFYWTAMDANRTTASLIGSATMNLNLATGGTPCVVIGNTGRNPGGNTANALKDNFLGLIDEVRVSKVARSAGQMMFSTPAISIDVNPVDQVTVLGQTVNFNVSASGVPVLHYQWRHDNVNILNATQAVYTIPAVALADVGAYDVIVTNNYSSVTSSPASLTLRSPVDLTWQGNGYPTWDIGLSPAWRDSGFATAIYTEGDNVTFDAEGAGYPAISIDTPVYPSSVTVNADNDYTFTTSASGGIAGFAGLVKQGIGTLILDENNSYRGGTRIAAGAIQVGSGGTRGSLGTGAITNNGGLVFNRTDAIDVNNKISGTGGITNNGAGTVTLKGTNNYSGDIWGTAGAIVAASPQALGGTTNVTISASLGSPGITGTRFALSGGITVGPNVTLNMLGAFASPDLRCNFYTASGTNTWNGPVFFDFGDGTMAFAADAANAELNINGAVSGPSFMGKLILRGGGGRGSLNGPINLPSAQVSKTDNSLWTIRSTGNSWLSSDIAAGTLQIGANNALPTAVTLNLLGGTFDLGGFNQTIGGFNGANAGSIVGSSSTTSDSILTVNATGSWTNTGVIQDSISGGTRRVGLTVAAGSLALTAANTYSGDTTISSGTLALIGTGSIASSSIINVSAGATLDVSGRSGGGMTVSAGQTLKGNGAFNVVGGLTNAGTVELKINKTGATVTFDRIAGLSKIAYGGTLKLNLSGSALAATDSFKLFTSAAYSGAFTSLNAPAPGPGLAWYTGTLATDGTLRIVSIPSIGHVTMTKTSLTLSGTGGPANMTYYIMATDDITQPLSNWYIVDTGTFDATGNFSITTPATNYYPDFYTKQQFFQIVIP